MGALGQYIESGGVATTQISLIREHTEAIRPPRALWVPFILGRPFGVPGDALFQERVLLASLRLLEAPSGPVLEDYPEEAPPAHGDDARQVCPVAFGSDSDADGLRATFLREVDALAPWHDLARERRGRTVLGLTEEPIRRAAQRLAAFIERENVEPAPSMTLGQTLKVACEEVRAYYYEAAAARPGNPDPVAVDAWFWRQTAAGRVFLAFHALSAASPDPSVRALSATSIVPRAVLRDREEAAGRDSA